MALITIVTPTYNRGKEIQNLFNSLTCQTCMNFEWLIIDDGSVDHTGEVIEKVKETANFPIKYIKKKNGGKHTALNVAFEQVETELLFIVDSDDTLTPTAIEQIQRDWEKTKKERYNLCGMSYLRGHSDNQPIGDLFPQNYGIDSFANVRVNQNIQGDKAEVWATKYLKDLRFPVYEEEKFLVESYIWLQVSKRANMLFVNKVIYLTEYLEGGLTKSGRRLRIKCPQGGMAFSVLAMEEEYPLKNRLKAGILYSAYSFFAKKNIKETFNIPYKSILTISYLPGYFLYLLWKFKFDK